MKKVVLYIAMSLDGFIADADGNVGWLVGQDEAAETEDTYSEFVKDVDTVVMGWNTYHQIVTQLSPGEWVYGDLTSYVITHRGTGGKDTDADIRFVQEEPCSLIRWLREEKGGGETEKAIWICGGAAVIQPLVQEDLIDEYDISVIPSVLGSGIRLFKDGEGETGQIPLWLLRTEATNGIIRMVYRRRNEGRIRRIRQEDDASLAAIVRKNLESCKLNISGTAYFDPELDHLSRYYNERPEKRAYFVAEDEMGRTVGGAGVAEYAGFENCAELQKLYLTDDAKGKGIGRRLLQTAEAFARKNGYERMYLETHSKLKAALRLYKRAGFLQIEPPQGVVHGTMDTFFVKEF